MAKKRTTPKQTWIESIRESVRNAGFKGKALQQELEARWRAHRGALPVTATQRNRITIGKPSSRPDLRHTRSKDQPKNEQAKDFLPQNPVNGVVNEAPASQPATSCDHREEVASQMYNTLPGLEGGHQGHNHASTGQLLGPASDQREDLNEQQHDAPNFYSSHGPATKEVEGTEDQQRMQDEGIANLLSVMESTPDSQKIQPQSGIDASPADANARNSSTAINKVSADPYTEETASNKFEANFLGLFTTVEPTELGGAQDRIFLGASQDAHAFIKKVLIDNDSKSQYKGGFKISVGGSQSVSDDTTATDVMESDAIASAPANKIHDTQETTESNIEERTPCAGHPKIPPEQGADSRERPLSSEGSNTETVIPHAAAPVQTPSTKPQDDTGYDSLFEDESLGSRKAAALSTLNLPGLGLKPTAPHSSPQAPEMFGQKQSGHDSSVTHGLDDGNASPNRRWAYPVSSFLSQSKVE